MIGAIAFAHGDDASLKARLRPYQIKALNDIATCGTEACGMHREPGDHCGDRRMVPNTCQNRHCPHCQGNKRAQWVAARTDELLPCDYLHAVFKPASRTARNICRFSNHHARSAFAGRQRCRRLPLPRSALFGRRSRTTGGAVYVETRSWLASACPRDHHRRRLERRTETLDTGQTLRRTTHHIPSAERSFVHRISTPPTTTPAESL
jgi:Transposase zinc-binding domain